MARLTWMFLEVWLALFSISISPFPLPNFHTCDALPQDRPSRQARRRLFPNESRANIRTAFHFQPKANWMNDPNGLMLYRGYYHLFYQYNPDAPVWGNITWGHAVSTDMVNWKHLPIALRPDRWYDSNGVWSGSATIGTDGVPVLSYTGDSDARQQLQCLAFPKDPSDPLLVEWVKWEHNPISTTPPGINASEYRDPSTAWQGEDGVWRMVVGAEALDGADEVLMLRSADFLNWTVGTQPVHKVPARKGTWECPELYPVAENSSNGLDLGYYGPGAKYVIKASFNDVIADFYAIGTYTESPHDTWSAAANGFDITGGVRYDQGEYYASRTFFDSVRRRRVLYGWVPELDSVDDDYTKGWASLQALPRTVALDMASKQHLLLWPIDEVDKLRGEKVQRSQVTLKPGARETVAGVSGSQVDVEIEFDVPSLVGLHNATLGPFGVEVLASSGAEESTAIYFEAAQQNGGEPVFRFVTDLTRSSTRDEVEKPEYGAVLRGALSGTLSLRVLVDNTIVEAFAQQGQAVTTGRVYPTLAIGEFASLALFNRGTVPVLVKSFGAWNMSAAKTEYHV